MCIRDRYNTAEILLLGNNVEDDRLTELKSKVDCHDVVNMQYTSDVYKRQPIFK